MGVVEAVSYFKKIVSSITQWDALSLVAILDCVTLASIITRSKIHQDPRTCSARQDFQMNGFIFLRLMIELDVFS